MLEPSSKEKLQTLYWIAAILYFVTSIIYIVSPLL
ncbi:hypothetical protein DFQ09_11061 [Winogradskyella pacifica]|uniref:Uncharacterized protein n=1 Tax=Winogradskyella pacifica TaxID=664642 RepID=A0A3D9LN84_9FLAO|nr:hypothetical protein DFQ09_11061 [Winogradskyella pacifica]